MLPQNTVTKRSLNSESKANLNVPTARNKASIFHKSNVAFLPEKEKIPYDIDAIAHLPPPHVLRRDHYRKNPHQEVSFAAIAKRDEADKNRASEEKPPPPPLLTYDEKRKSEHFRPVKLHLPPPYKKHKAVIEERRASRDFKYGKDEEYTITDRDRRVKAPCSGVLFFHTMELLNLKVNKQSFFDNIPISYYLSISIGSIRRTTKIVHHLGTKMVKIDSGVHLPIDVSEYRQSPLNRIRLELWSFQDPEHHFIVGTCEIHIYDFIRLQHAIDYSSLWSDGIKVGKVAYEAAFSYGAYGYGHSNQLVNFSQPVMETVSHSMFPRIKLDDQVDIADKAFQARKPDNLKLLSYHSFILEMDDAKGQDLHDALGDQNLRTRRKKKRGDVFLTPKPITAHQVEVLDGFPDHALLRMNIYQKPLQADFNDMYGEYICFGHKRERLEYLSNMVQGRMRDMFEAEAGTIFQHLEERDIEKIGRAARVPGEIIFPKKVPCTTSAPVEVTSEDNTFQDKHFPAVRREPGCLDKLFGYEKKQDPSEFLNNMDSPQYLMKPPKKTKTVQKCCTSCYKSLQIFFLKMQDFFLQLWAFIFPNVTHNLDVPDISVTIATPQGSTTEIYSYFAREGKDHSRSKVDKLVEQTSALIGMTNVDGTKHKKKRHSVADDDESDSSSDSGNADEEKLKEDLKKKRLSKFE